MSVGRICTREVHFAEPGESIRDAALRMLDRRVGCLVVLDPQRVPVGMLTDRDLVIRVIAAGRDPARTTVADVMTPDPRVAPETAAIEDALAWMRHGKFRRLPVVGAEGRLVGLVAADDILDLLAEEIGELGSLVE
jgi:CBS domain-containing protein